MDDKPVDQPSAWPTRKLIAAMLAASATAAVKAYVLNMWPFLNDPVIWEPLPILVGAVTGYYVRDLPNS